MPLPSFIHLNRQQSFPVLHLQLEPGRLGYFDRETGEIAIEINQPEAGKHIILLHELIHFTAELLIQAGLLDDQPDESFVENAAPVLLSMLVRSGLWGGLSIAELEDFVEAEILREDQ